MKIAFLEYFWNIRAGGEINFILGWKTLLEKKHKIDFIQYSSKVISSDVKHISKVDINDYDVVIVNSVYSSEIELEKNNAVLDFLYYCSKLNKPLLVINHTRYEQESLYRLYIVNKLMNLSTVCMSYFANNTFYAQDAFRPCYHLNLDYFYKPAELHTVLLDKNLKKYDLVWANNLVPAKHPEKFLDFVDDNKSLFPKTAMLGYRDYTTDKYISEDNLNTKIRNDKRINYLGRQNSIGYIDLYPFISDFGLMQKFYASSKFSVQLNASYYNDYKIIEKPWGLEGATLESLIAGCIPIVDSRSRDYIVKGKKLEDYNCCVFLDKDAPEYTNREILEKAVEDYDWLYANCLQFSREVLRDIDYIEYNVTKVLIETINRFNNQDIRDLSKLGI